MEKPITLKEEHFSLRGKIDLAYPDRSRVVVVDWKTGSANGGEDSLQLLSYALGAMQEFGCASGDVELYGVYLGDSSVSAYTVSEGAILRAKARIIQDLERMRTLEDYGRNAVVDAFTPCGQTRTYSFVVHNPTSVNVVVDIGTMLFDVPADWEVTVDPSDSLTLGPNEEAKVKVFVEEGGVAKERIVKLGSKYGELMEVVEGLQGGEKVVVAGQQNLSEGVKLNVAQ